ncbi:DUF6427 family protein [Galbibacter mesophilus]|nr:DUF6427 family protein [Galbibacter mesophilus]
MVGGFFLYLHAPFNIQILWKLFQSFVLILISLFLVDFVNRKNFLTRSHSYTIFFFVLVFCLFPKIFNEINLLIANAFILLSFRRLVSIRSNKDVEIKIFDASLWVFIATFFYSWSVFFILLVYASIFLYKKNDYRNLLIPLVAFFTVLSITFTAFYLLNDLQTFYGYLLLLPKLVLEKYEDFRYIVPLIFLFIMGVWSTIAFFIRKQSKSFVTRVPGILIMVMLGIAILVAIVSESANTSEVIFSIFPLSVIMAKYVESINRLWLKEIFLWSFIVMPFVTLFL